MIWLVEMLAAGTAIAGIVSIALIVWPLAAARLPDPSAGDGWPMAGPASQKAAHAAINRKQKHRRGG